MENMDKGLTVPKLLLINQPKIPQMSKNLFLRALKSTLYLYALLCVFTRYVSFDKAENTSLKLELIFNPLCPVIY